MANGYLGKISAIVSANTSDFQSKLNGAAKDVRSFASSMQTSLGNAQKSAGTSLRGIYTEAQKLERALQAAASGKLSFKGFAGPDLDSAVKRMQAFASVAKEISGPLSAGARSLEKLSMGVQAAFNPALRQAQVLTERLADEINKTGTVSEDRFHRIVGVVNEATAAIGRMAEAEKLAGNLFSGKELRFQAPALAAELARSASIDQTVAGLPPQAIAGGDYARLVAQRQAALEDANRLYGAMENERQLPGGDVEAATAAFERQLSVVAQINDQLDRMSQIEMNIGAKTDISQMGLRSSLADRQAKLREQMLEKNAGAKTDISQMGWSSSLAARRNKLAAEAAEKAQRLEDERRSADAASRFGGTVSTAFDAAKLTSYQAKLRILQEILIGAGVSAGDAAEEVDEFAAALQNAASKKGGLQAAAAGLKMQEDAAINAVAAAVPGAGGAKRVRQRLARAGDVGRAGIDKFSLGLNQAAFAVDDFMSSTGGLEQKLRAVSNNVTQLGFIVGGTAGLFTSLGAVIAGQTVVALVKWANNGVDAEDKTKALNDALARQKSLVEELAQAYRTLGDSLARGTLSTKTEETQGLQKERDAVLKKRAEQTKEQIAGVDPTVLKEKATQSMLEKQINESTSVGRVVILQQRMRESKEREKQARAVASVNTPRDKDVVAGVRGRAVQLIRENATAQYRSENFAEAYLGMRDMEQRDGELEAAKARARKAAEAQSAVGLRNALQEELNASQADRSVSPADNARNDELMRQLQEMIAKLNVSIALADNKIVEQILNGGIAVNRALTDVQSLLDETVAPFSRTRDEAEKASNRLKDITTERENGTTPERNVELQKEMEALKQQAAAHRSAAEVVRTFADTIKRVSTDLADTVSGEATSSAEKARRDANRANSAAFFNGEWAANGGRNRPGDPAVERERAGKRARDAEAEAKRAQDEADRVRRRNEQRRMEFEASVGGDPQVQAERRRLEELQAIIDDASAETEDRARAAEEKASIQRAQERRFEASPQGVAARAAADAADQAAANAQETFRQQDERFRAAMRGRDVGISDAEKAKREAKEGMLDLAAARDEGLLTEAQFQEQANRFGRQQMEQAAPAIASMAEEVQNAILQGPSRAALEVKDVSSVEGQRELNRLLRGDDSAKNANIVELEKQNQKLVEVVNVLRDIARNAGIVIDL